jgi:hypothetical protein
MENRHLFKKVLVCMACRRPQYFLHDAVVRGQTILIKLAWVNQVAHIDVLDFLSSFLLFICVSLSVTIGSDGALICTLKQKRLLNLE